MCMHCRAAMLCAKPMGMSRPRSTGRECKTLRSAEEGGRDLTVGPEWTS